MKFNVHGGHNRHVPGIISYLDEVTEDRKISKELQKLLTAEGHIVHDCTDDSARTQNGNLNNIVKKCNKKDVNLNISVHLNGCKKVKKDGKVKGVEVWVSSMSSKAVPYAKRVCSELAKLGFTNRGVKGCKENNRSLAVIRRTKDPAMLIEVCFADDEDDILRYKKLGYKTVTKAIAEGILNRKISSKTKAVSKHFKIKAKQPLVIWSSPTSGATKRGKIDKGDMYTITKVAYKGKMPYGKLLSGAGWIKIHTKYVDRM